MFISFLNFSQQYNPQLEIAVSADKKGMVEFWTGPKQDYTFPRRLKWEYKTDTDLYEFAKVCFKPEFQTVNSRNVNNE